MKKQVKEGIVFDSGMLKLEDQKCECGSEFVYSLVLFRKCKALDENDKKINDMDITDVKVLGEMNKPFQECMDYDDVMTVELEKGTRLINNIGIR